MSAPGYDRLGIPAFICCSTWSMVKRAAFCRGGNSLNVARNCATDACTRNWHTVAEHSRFVDLADLRQRFASADYVRPFTVFDVGGNNYRIVAVVHYRDGKIFLRWVMNHRDYDKWCKLYRKGKVQ